MRRRGVGGGSGGRAGLPGGVIDRGGPAGGGSGRAPTGRDSTGRDSTGRDGTGRDATRRDPTGRARTDRERGGGWAVAPVPGIGPGTGSPGTHPSHFFHSSASLTSRSLPPRR